MSSYLFVYGTLLPQHAPREIEPAVAKLRRLDEGTVRGLLYDLGGYPGAVLDESEAGRIHGTVFELPDEDEFHPGMPTAGAPGIPLLQRLDDYEGFDPQNVQASLFVRKLCPVTLATGETLQCWIYLYNREPRNAPRIPGGRYPGT